MKTAFESQYKSLTNEAGGFAHGTMNCMDVAARAGVVNRTHRVVRERARVLQQRQSRVRGLVAPLIVCSVLLLLTGFAIWSGLYQYQTSAQADVNALTSTDTGNQLSAVLLWFVPVSITLLAIVLYRRSHKAAEALR